MYERSTVALIFCCVIASLCSMVALRFSDLKKINKLQNTVNSLVKENEELKNNVSLYYKKTDISIFKLKEKVSVISASIKPDNKRWARIKQVRKIIVDVMKSFGKNDLTIKEITDISTAIIDFSEENDVSVPLLLSIMTVESAFNVKAVSKADARGLMQVMPDTATEISIEIGQRNFNLFRIKDNVRFGAYYIRKMISHFGSLDLAISAYNCGPMCVERVQSGEYSNYPQETVKYLERVKTWKTKYEDLGVN